VQLEENTVSLTGSRGRRIQTRNIKKTPRVYFILSNLSSSTFLLDVSCIQRVFAQQDLTLCKFSRAHIVKKIC